MKRSSPAVALAAILCTAAVWAAPPGAPERPGLTRAEFLARQARLFDAWDRDRDGVLSAQEQAAMHAAQPGAAPQAKPARALLHPSK